MKNSRGEIIGKHLDEWCQNDFLCNIPEQIKKTKKKLLTKNNLEK